MRARRPAPFLAVLVLLPLLAAGAASAQGPLDDEIVQRRQELAALDRYLGHLRELLAAASRGELLLRDDRAGLLHTVPRGTLGELARTAAALPASVRPLARPSVPPGTAPDTLVAALAAETRAQVDRELVPQISALERARSGTAERIAWLEQEVQRRAEEARLAAEQARKAAEERARIEAERQRVEAERARLEAERQRVEAEQRRLAEQQARIEAELARTRPQPAPPAAVAPGPASGPAAQPAVLPAALPLAPTRRAFERVEALQETRSVRVEPPAGGGPSQQISVGRTPEGFVLFNLWLDRDRRLGSFVCSWAVRGLDDPIPPGRELTVELAGRCASEAGPPLPIASVLRLEVDGLELVADRRRGPPEVWTGTKDGELRLETVGSFVLRAPKAARPGDELRLRLVQPGCCTPLTMTWRYPG
jgi:hypothetical protein